MAEVEKTPSESINTEYAVEGFLNEYRACEKGEVPDEIFSIGRLRDYFGAWPTPMAIGSGADDPLVWAVERLAEAGMKMQGTAFAGSAILVKRKLG